MATPGNLSSKKVKNSYKAIVQHDGGTSKLYDGTGSMVNSIDVTRVTASNAKIGTLVATSISASSLTVDKNLAVSGSTFLGDTCGTDQVKIHGNTWVSGALTVSGSCQGSLRSIGQAKFIYLDNPVIEDQKPAKITRVGTGFIRGRYNVPRFGGKNAALDVYGNAVISGSLIVTDTVFAQEFHSEQISQSIIYTSGSTKFGGDWEDTMTVTGSIFQSGSDAYFLNGIGIGTSGSQKAGTFADAGQDNPVEFTHLLRIDDPGHDGLQHKKGKLIYGTFGSVTGAPHVSSSDVVRFRDTGKDTTDDVFVISSISQSVFFSTNDKYNVGIGVPSGSNSKIDEKLVVSSSSDTRVKIESATKATSASLYLESGQGVWELAVASRSAAEENMLEESLVFRTRNSKAIHNAWSANGTYAESLRLNNLGKAGFNIPYDTATYELNQQVTVSGSLNIIQGRTININAGDFHNSDGLNGIYFNNQKMIYVSGSGVKTNYFFGFEAGNTGTATEAFGNIGLGTQTGVALSTGGYNIMLGQGSGTAINTGYQNTLIGYTAGTALTNGTYNIALGYRALLASSAATHTIAIGYDSMNNGDATGNSNIGIGIRTLQEIDAGGDNIAIGTDALADSHTGNRNIAIGYRAIYDGDTSGNDNIAIGTKALEDVTTASGSIAIGHGAAKQHTTGNGNIAIGSGSMGAGIAAAGVDTDGQNTAVGPFSLKDLTQGARNVAIGYKAAEQLTVAHGNIAIGDRAMFDGVVSGENNIAIGKLALKNTTNAASNIAIGYRALRDTVQTAERNIAIGNQVAYDGILVGLDNILMGTETATAATSLAQNVVIGHKAVLTGVMTGDNNTVLGSEAAQIITSGADNVIIGHNAGSKTLTTNTNNILIGSRPSASAALDNAYAIGNQALVTQANSMVLGGQTGEKFNIGIGGITAPNATLEVSGTVNVTGSLTVSGSSTFTNFGKALLYGNAKNEEDIGTGLSTETALVVSGTSIFKGHTHMTGNLYVSDIIVAQEFHTEYVSASITFTSGSNKMGDTNDDQQMMTGSLRVTGSGPHYYMGRQENGVSKAGDNALVGINTMIPHYELDVAGNIGVDEYIYHNDNTGTDDTWLRFQDNNVSIAADAQVNLTIVPATVTVGDGGDVDFVVRTDNDLHTIHVLGSNDNVGIGTATPVNKLQVAGTISGSKALYIGGANGSISASNGNLHATGHITSSINIWVSNSINHSKPHTGNYISASILIASNHITASGNISASGFISSSHFAGPSASFDNIMVTGSGGGKGTGSFGFISTETIKIHNHEIVGGQGLTVAGAKTQLGYGVGDGGTLNHAFEVYGQSTMGGTLWVSKSSHANGTGHISASTLQISDDLTIQGNISGSWISASRGVWTAGNVTASGNITSSGTIYAQNINIGPHPNPHTSLAQILATDIKIGEDDQTKIDFETANEIHFYAANAQEMVIQANVVAPGADDATALGDANQRWSDLFLAEGAVINFDAGDATITQTGNKLAFGGIVEASFANGASTPTHITVEGSGSFGGNVSGSLTSTGSFGDGRFINRVGIGTNDPDCSLEVDAAADDLIARFNSTTNEDIVKGIRINAPDASGTQLYMDLVVDPVGNKVGIGIGNGSGNLPIGDANLDNAELVIDSSGNIGIGTSSPTELLTVAGNVSASGNIKIAGSLASTNYRSFYVAAAGMTPGVNGGAAAGTDEYPGGGGGTNYQTIDYLSFAGGGATKNYANFQLTMPGEWDRHVLKAKFHYLTATGTTNSVAFGINMTPISNNESMGFSENIFETIEDTGLNDTGKLHTSPATAYISASNGASASLHDVVCFRVIRDPALDTYTGAARLLGLTLQYREQYTTPEAAW